MLLLLILSLFLLGVVKGFISQSTTCQSRWASTNHSAHFTFVVPAFHSLSSLETTVQSIISLKNPDWYLVIAFHGLVSNTFYLNETSQLPIADGRLTSKVQTNANVQRLYPAAEPRLSCWRAVVTDSTLSWRVVMVSHGAAA